MISRMAATISVDESRDWSVIERVEPAKTLDLLSHQQRQQYSLHLKTKKALADKGEKKNASFREKDKGGAAKK